jgi:SAM-dependent methyltransferase
MKTIISPELSNKIVCPKTKKKLSIKENKMICVHDRSITYPIINGIPILINDNNSIFSIEDFNFEKDSIYNEKQTLMKMFLRSITPTISNNIKAENNYKKIASLLPHNAKILVMGGGTKGAGIDPIYSVRNFEVIGADVYLGPYTKIICDAHDIPFENDTFDCVIIQAVLEHVLDPQRCVDELYRVLKKRGLVYSETPFMQQVHMRQYDFMRFTHLGHRKLFKFFEEIESGVVAGPGAALAWSYTYFLRSFGRSKRSIKVLTKFAYFTAFFFKYFDHLLINRPGSYDAASGFYFIGVKSEISLSDSDLIRQFRGNI